MFKIGDRVKRNDSINGATVITAVESLISNSWSYELSYDEGSTGWWPEDCLILIETTVVAKLTSDSRVSITETATIN